ncbi:MAG: HAD family phosphatase, partial [Ignavibacteriae bacterium]|nr:HAD family phosphatase [Ignavibacteriota bacterium]
HVHGKTNKRILEYLLKRPIIAEELKTLSLQKESLYQSLCLQNAEEFQLSPGANDFLDFLVANNIPHTIATASQKGNLDFFIKHLKLDRWFDISKIVYDDGRFSSKLEMFIQAAENLHLSPEQCIVIEDSQSGIIAALGAKIGKIVGLGPKEVHECLLGLQGISEAITSLSQIEKEKLFEMY